MVKLFIPKYTGIGTEVCKANAGKEKSYGHDAAQYLVISKGSPTQDCMK